MPDTSVGTNPGTKEGYLSVPVADNVHYGVGAYILLSIEAARLRGEID